MTKIESEEEFIITISLIDESERLYLYTSNMLVKKLELTN